MAKNRNNVDLKGFRKKMKYLSALSDHTNKFMQDGADFIRDKLVDEQLSASNQAPPWNGLPRRVLRAISGNLGRSFTDNPKVERRGSKIIKIRLQHNENKAGYGRSVFNKARRKTGKTPPQWTKFFYEKRVQKAFKKTIKGLAKDINRGNKPRYFKPEEFR